MACRQMPSLCGGVDGGGVWRAVVWRAVPVVRGGQWCVEGGASGDRDDGGCGGGFASCVSGWSLLAFTVAKMESVPIEGDRCLTGPGEAGVENASRLPGRNSCHRQMSSPCGAWRVVGTMMVVVGSCRAMVDEERWWWWWWWRHGGGGEGDAVVHATLFFWWGVGGCRFKSAYGHLRWPAESGG